MYFIVYGLFAGFVISQTIDIKNICSSLYKKLYHASSLEKVSSQVYSLSYTHNGKSYSMFIPIRKGPKKITRVTTELDEDVTDNVMKWMGPNQDFHQHIYPITPNVLGYKFLAFHTHKGTTLSFSRDEECRI